MKDEYDFSNAKRGAIIPPTLEKAIKIINKQCAHIRSLKKEITEMRDRYATYDKAFQEQDDKLSKTQMKLNNTRQKLESKRKEIEQPQFDDHEIAQLVNDLTSIAKTYAGTEQLREHISKCIVARIKYD